jgi:HD-GYP domain-containing protein (c-di-GMP phosphodiesterase class II)
MMVAAIALPIASNLLTGYMPVQVEMLKRMRHSPVDLFIQYETNVAPVLYHRANCPLEARQAARLDNTAIRQIYVRVDDFQQFTAHLLQSMDSDLEQESISASERFAALQLAMSVEIEHAARLLDCGPYVAMADKLGRELTSLLANNNVLPRDLYRLARHDFNTFTHITNVASYSVVFAERLGLCGGNDLASLAKAAILHDIGKRFIPVSILTKPAKLNPDERAIIETHPQRGYEELCMRDEMTNDQLMIVYQHHERYDGTGYPVGLPGQEIHPWARMIAIVDFFDAVTGRRPYRPRCSAQDALDYIGKNAGQHFDPEMVQCWNSMMAKN